MYYVLLHFVASFHTAAKSSFFCTYKLTATIDFRDCLVIFSSHKCKRKQQAHYLIKHKNRL